MNNNKVRLISALKNQTISVGVLASNWLSLPETLHILQQHQHKLLHFDIADGHFSPLFTVGAIGVKQFPPSFIKDVHLMVENPFPIAQECVKAGATSITLQIENKGNLVEIYEWLNQQSDLLSGISLCPDTALDLLDQYLAHIDLIQILALDPRTGFKMSQDLLFKRMAELKTKLDTLGYKKLIAVDGSMNLALAEKLQQFEIDWVVAGSGLFAHKDFAQELALWKQTLNKNNP